jgi:hypothetical protein
MLIMGGQPASQQRRGARSCRGPGVQRVWLAAGTVRSNGDMVRATTSLLSRGPLSVRRWVGRPWCHSLVRTGASPGPDRLGRARTECTLYAHQAARAGKPVQSRRNVCRASFLMKLSAAARRYREEPPEACGNGCHVADYGRPEASHALSSVAPDWDYP